MRRPTLVIFSCLGLAISVPACATTGTPAAPKQAGGNQAQAGSMLTPADPDQICGVYFGTYDANGDGVATRAEYDAAKLIPAGYGAPAAHTQGTVSADGTTASGPVNTPPTQAELAASFQKLDTNKDGKLQKAETCAAFQAPTRSAP